MCPQQATAVPSDPKLALENDIALELGNFTKELDRSRRRAEKEARMFTSLMDFHQHFCNETNKSFQRLQKKLQQMQPAEPVSLLNYSIASARVGLGVFRV